MTLREVLIMSEKRRDRKGRLLKEENSRTEMGDTSIAITTYRGYGGAYTVGGWLKQTASLKGRDISRRCGNWSIKSSGIWRTGSRRTQPSG